MAPRCPAQDQQPGARPARVAAPRPPTARVRMPGGQDTLPARTLPGVSLAARGSPRQTCCVLPGTSSLPARDSQAVPRPSWHWGGSWVWLWPGEGGWVWPSELSCPHLPAAVTGTKSTRASAWQSGSRKGCPGQEERLLRWTLRERELGGVKSEAGLVARKRPNHVSAPATGSRAGRN